MLRDDGSPARGASDWGSWWAQWLKPESAAPPPRSSRSLADWLDIDSPESIPAAPMIGFRIEGDRLVLQDRPGLGFRRV